MSHLRAVLPILRTINAATFPGITHASRTTIKELLEENKKNHIFFNEKHFHNHVVHHLLDSYALGCSPARLHEIYREHTQRPAPPKSVQITQSNWKEHMENDDRWTDLMEFFSSEVQQLGIDGALDKYFFHPELFGRFFADVNHGLIHLGFGIVFQEPLIVAEGLALATLHPNIEFLLHIPPSSSSSTSLLDIFEQVRNDKRFDGLVTPTTSDPHSHVSDNAKPLLYEYIGKWDVKGTKEDVAAKDKELFQMIVLLYAATIRPGKHPMFDFHLMHSLTGSVFLHELLQHLSSEKGAVLLRAHFGLALMYYIATARPKLYVDNLKSYIPKIPTMPNPWLEIVKFAIEANDVHATKVAYSLLQGEAWFGEFDGIYLTAAQITADAVLAQPNHGIFQPEVWNSDGLGFDQTWRE